MKLTKEGVLEAKDIKTKELDIPEWSGTITIKSLSLSEHSKIVEASQKRDGTYDNAKLSLSTFIEGVLDPKFTPADVDALQKKSSVVITRIVREISNLSGITSGDETKNV